MLLVFCFSWSSPLGRREKEMRVCVDDSGFGPREIVSSHDAPYTVGSDILYRSGSLCKSWPFD